MWDALSFNWDIENDRQFRITSPMAVGQLSRFNHQLIGSLG